MRTSVGDVIAKNPGLLVLRDVHDDSRIIEFDGPGWYSRDDDDVYRIDPNANRSTYSRIHIVVHPVTGNPWQPVCMSKNYMYLKKRDQDGETVYNAVKLPDPDDGGYLALGYLIRLKGDDVIVRKLD